MMSAEHWLPVAGYRGLYEVSDQGRVRRLPQYRVARVARLLRPRPTRKGYVRVALYSGGPTTRDEQAIHRIVATAFIGPSPAPDSEVNHKDGNKLNNHLSNLEWTTPDENRAHAIALGLRRSPRGESHPKAKLTWVDVRAIRAATDATHVELSRRFGVSRPVIRDIRLGRIWKEAQPVPESGAA